MPDTLKTRLLLVDDDDDLRETLCMILEHGGFIVQSASNVNSALKLIASDIFDVLVSDLHMPNEGDGLTVVSAMRNANPNAVTIIFSAYPEMKKATAAILAQTDDIFVKPAAIGTLVDLIRARVKAGTSAPREVETVATILEQGTDATFEIGCFGSMMTRGCFVSSWTTKGARPICRNSSGIWSSAYGTHSPWAAMRSNRLLPPSMVF